MVYVLRDFLELTQIHEQVKHVRGLSANANIGIVFEHVKIGWDKLLILRLVEKTYRMNPHHGIRVGEQGTGKVVKRDDRVGIGQSLKLLEQELFSA